MDNSVAHKLEAKHRTVDVKLKELTTFNNMLLSDSLKKGLQQAGFLFPTIIQATAIPVGKSGLDLLIQSKSGTGKTLIFCTIILEAYEQKIQEPQSLCIVPTREIAIQTETVLNQIGRYCPGFKAVSVIGGIEVGDDRKRLAHARAVVGTPGRLLHLLHNGVLNTAHIKLLVLDEADKLYTHKFRKDIENIEKTLLKEKQIIACSATFCNDLDKHVAKNMRNPIMISTDNNGALLLGIKQFVYELPEKKSSIIEMQSKLDALREIFSRVSFQQCLIFAGSQSRADSYRNYLEKDGWECDLISGAQDQKTRIEMFRKFREYKTRIMISTDLMARGVDSEHVNLVINLELPTDMVTYLHRIGRAGRFGSHGIAINIVASANDHRIFKRLISEIGNDISVLKFPTNNESKFDIWDFSNSQKEAQQYGLYNMEKLASLSSQKKSLIYNTQIDSSKILNNSVTESSIDTKTFHENSKDSAFNKLAIYIDGLETDKYPPNHQQEQPSILLNSSSQHSSTQMLPSSNTIDDASSITVDSLQSSQQDISRYTALIEKSNIPKLFEYLTDHKNENLNFENKKHSTQAIDLFDDYTEEVLKNKNESIEKINCAETKSNIQINILKSLLIDNPKITMDSEKVDHLYSDYTNFNEHETLLSNTSNTSSMKTTENVDNVTFVLSIATPSHAQESLEELRNSCLNASQLDTVTDTISAPAKQHFTSPAHIPLNDTVRSVLSTRSKFFQQNLSIKVVESINIEPKDTNSIRSDSYQGSAISSTNSESTNSSSQAERGSSGFNEDTNNSESSGIETTDLEENNRETSLSESSFDSHSEDQSYEVTDDDSKSKDDDSNSIDFRADTDGHTEDYQVAYDRWINLYWTQLGYVQNYLKIVSYAKRQTQ